MGPPLHHPQHQQEEEGVMVGGGGGAGGSPSHGEEDAKAVVAARVRAQMDTQAQASFMKAVGDMLVCPLW